MGRATLDVANVPDAPPLGVGLVETGAYAVTRGGRVVAGEAEVPRAADTSRGADLFVGWGFPSHFLEGGTIKMEPHPFVGPAMDQVVPNKDKYLRDQHRRRR